MANEEGPRGRPQWRARDGQVHKAVRYKHDPVDAPFPYAGVTACGRFHPSLSQWQERIEPVTCLECLVEA